MTTKRCATCQEDKSRTSFSPDGRKGDGLQGSCRQCRATTERSKRGKRDLRERQGHHFKARYGITVDDYDRLLGEQGGKCAVCGDTPEHRLHVDHDHDTGRVRGLLCTWCNKGLGAFRDNPDKLLGAAAYLLQQQNVLTEVTI